MNNILKIFRDMRKMVVHARNSQMLYSKNSLNKLYKWGIYKPLIKAIISLSSPNTSSTSINACSLNNPDFVGL